MALPDSDRFSRVEAEGSFEVESELVLEDESPSVLDVDRSDPSPELAESDSDTFVSPPDRDEAERVALDARSFFAQPLPLKCTAGVLKPLRSVPSAPHAGQKRGPSAVMP